MFFHLLARHFTVGDHAVHMLKSDLLPISRGNNSLANGIAVLPHFFAGQFVKLETRDFDVDIDPIENGAGNLALIADDV